MKQFWLSSLKNMCCFEYRNQTAGIFWVVSSTRALRCTAEQAKCLLAAFLLFAIRYTDQLQFSCQFFLINLKEKISYCTFNAT